MRHSRNEPGKDTRQHRDWWSATDTKPNQNWDMTATTTDRSEASPLIPKDSPGRRDRRARAFAAQIRELQARGYTLDAIRQALADAGVHVSRSTVHREATRPTVAVAARAVGAPSLPTLPPDPGLAPAPITPGPALRTSAGPAQQSPPSSKDLAAAYFEGHIANELIRANQRAKEHP